MKNKYPRVCQNDMTLMSPLEIERDCRRSKTLDKYIMCHATKERLSKDTVSP